MGRPRILFLADRNNLADQAYNDFSAFSEDALKRIDPKEIGKTGSVPKNASVFFTIFQTFMSGKDDSFYFGEYPPDFFDFIVIDECHRGGANDESTWRGILEYFSPAVQLGLTATPKRRGNVDTYAYFGEPVYIYSLKEGINDGFLTPFKVKQFSTTLDEYVYTTDDLLLEGEIEQGKRYEEDEFNKTIKIKARENYRVKLMMNEINQREKTISLVKVISERTIKGKTSKEKRYYISSEDLTPQKLGSKIRQHWSIENHLHWGKDVVFNEDFSQANIYNAAENLAMFRRVSQGLFKQESGSLQGTASNRRRAAWDDTYAIRVLGQLFMKNKNSLNEKNFEQ